MKLKYLTRFTCLSTLLPVSSFALNINLTPAAGMSQDSIDGFQRAANYWQSVLSDNATVNIDIDFRTLDPGVLGQAGSTTQAIGVDAYFAALGADITSASDLNAVANLPALTLNGGINFLTQVNSEGNSTAVSLDSDDSGNNRVLNLNTANAKAVGLRPANDLASDASITFSDRFAWDYDNSDGVGPGLQDFVGVAVHEIGHALGFNSGVDTVDFAIANSADLEDFRVFTGLDMFRYSADGVNDLAAGTVSYFSIDGGATNLGLFSTGSTYGDGQQASHWRDNLGLGIMDPTANPAGNVNTVSQLDLLAFDTIGWDITIQAVPEPSSSILLLGAGLGFVLRRKR
ncbi:hypothetical protein NT6N_10850 [Oceaniferula spumae]|uniref:Ice-binding protein C-terminal domain-containing protein n=1 Tax=Oceaniferula spumae TaxID=2979115 RepID=A0AAT9FJD2_9BACT